MVVHVTRRGDDASRLEIEVGQVRGREALRVIYPDDEIVYPEMGRRSNTNLTVRSDADDRAGSPQPAGVGPFAVPRSPSTDPRLASRSYDARGKLWADFRSLRVAVPSTSRIPRTGTSTFRPRVATR